MENSFTCTRKSYNNIGPIYISSKEEIEKITDDFIKLRCHIDDFLAANEEFKDIKGKTINYFIVMQENIEIKKFKSLFNVFETLKNYSNIYGLELKLKSKISKSNFQKLVNFLTSIQQKFELKLKLGNLEVFDINQLDKLSTINNNINTNIQINQSYEGKYTDNNGYDNLYDFEKLIKIKQKVEEIVNKIPADFNEVEKVLFLYKYLGKKIQYDREIASSSYEDRSIYDYNSIYDVLFNNRGVCSGFAVAFRILMNAIGIECQTVCSMGEEDGHEWNVIKINGLWYHLDLTFDLYNIKYGYKLQYFLKSEKDMLEDEDHQVYTYYAKEKEKANESLYVKQYTR